MAPIQRHVWPGCSTVSAYIMTDRALDVIGFARDVFGAELLDPPLLRADGTVWNAIIKLADSTVMLGDPRDPSWHRTAFLHVYVPDCDAAYRKALDHGASSMMEPSDQFYGDRAGGVTDMAGNIWWIATHQRTLPRAEVERLARETEASRS